MPNIYRVNFPNDENRGDNLPPKDKPKHKKDKKNKCDFNTLKCNTIKSLNEVEYFLNNFGQFVRCAKIYKLLKK